MRIEEAIDIIKSECYVFNPLNFDRSTMVNTALDMAVKALEQEPCEDCVSREAVLEHICEGKECYKEECKGRTLKRCPDLQWVFDLPSVKPQEPRTDVLDKIKAEIDSYCSDNRDKNDGLYIAMQIIDKYKGGSEG